MTCGLPGWGVADVDLHAFAESRMGPCEVASQTVAGGHSGRVARVRDGHGREYIAKQHSTAEKHRREVAAYRHWAAALGDGAARLVAADPEALMILVTALPGRTDQDAGEVPAHRQAGALLRRLHDAQPAEPLAGFPEWLATRIRWWRDQAAPLLSAGEQDLIDQHLVALHDLGTPSGGPCHLDYQPRNWLIDGTGTLRVIDFEHARVGLQARDFVRLQFRYWPTRPDLRAAFFDGYGRQLTAEEQQLVRHCGAIDALTGLVRGTKTSDTALAGHGRSTLRLLRHED
jgi:hypothetical protein